MTINELCTKAHKNAVKKGFYDKPLETGTLLMLAVSELGEALESDRKNRHCTETKPEEWLSLLEEKKTGTRLFELDIKDTFEDELADAVIRIADMAAYMGIDLEAHIIAKMRYNETRPAKHGKKY